MTLVWESFRSALRRSDHQPGLTTTTPLPFPLLPVFCRDKTTIYRRPCVTSLERHSLYTTAAPPT
jgi:hypothetical protein